jgi:hypothetical protein
MVDPRPTTPNDTPPSRRFTPSPIAVPALLLRARRRGVRRLEAGEWSGSTAGLLFGLLRCFEDAIREGRTEFRRRVTLACDALRGDAVVGRPLLSERASDEEIDTWLDTALVLHAEYAKALRAQPDADLLSALARLSRGRSRRSDDARLRAQMPAWCKPEAPFGLTERRWREMLNKARSKPQPLTLRTLQVLMIECAAGAKERTAWRCIAEWRRRLPGRAAQALRQAEALAVVAHGDQAVIDLLMQAAPRAANQEEIETP